MSDKARTAAWILILACGIPAGSFPTRGTTPQLEQRTRVDLAVRPLTAEPAAPGEVLPLQLVVRPEEPAEAALVLAWPDADSRATLKLRAVHARATSGHANGVDLDARLDLPDGRTVHASRAVRFDEDETVLFEVYRIDDKSLTLAVEAKASTETVISKLPSPGSMVRFRLEILRVLGERTVSLETNFLNTLLGEPVSYAFRLDNKPGADAASITIEPLELHGDIATIEIEVSGKLLLEDEVVMIGRNERWLASRGATLTLAFEAGEPPTGYRFLLTARF